MIPILDWKECPVCYRNHTLLTEDFAFWRVHALFGHFMGQTFEEIEAHARQPFTLKMSREDAMPEARKVIENWRSRR